MKTPRSSCFSCCYTAVFQICWFTNLEPCSCMYRSTKWVWESRKETSLLLSDYVANSGEKCPAWLPCCGLLVSTVCFAFAPWIFSCRGKAGEPQNMNFLSWTKWLQAESEVFLLFNSSGNWPSSFPLSCLVSSSLLWVSVESIGATATESDVLPNRLVLFFSRDCSGLQVFMMMPLQKKEKLRKESCLQGRSTHLWENVRVQRANGQGVGCKSNHQTESEMNSRIKFDKERRRKSSWRGTARETDNQSKGDNRRKPLSSLFLHYTNPIVKEVRLGWLFPPSCTMRCLLKRSGKKSCLFIFIVQVCVRLRVKGIVTLGMASVASRYHLVSTD